MPKPITNPKQRIAIAIAEKSKTKGFSTGKSLGSSKSSDLFKSPTAKTSSSK